MYKVGDILPKYPKDIIYCYEKWDENYGNNGWYHALNFLAHSLEDKILGFEYRWGIRSARILSGTHIFFIPVTELEKVWNEMESFKIPEKWYIEVTKENKKVLENYRISKCSSHYDINIFETDLILSEHPLDNSYCYKNNKKVFSRYYPNYVEITFEQFKKYILNNMNKQIIGYKAPYDMYEGKLKKGVLVKEFPQPHMNKAYGIPAENGFFESNVLIPKEIAQTWEPVYEENKLPKINGYDGKLDGDYIVYGCATFGKTFFHDVYKLSNPEYTGGKLQNKSVKSIKLDSGIEITMEQVSEIVEFLKNQK